jgi:hypothetical protein
MTVDEAKQCWCPFTQLQISGNTMLDNRGGGTSGSTPPLNYNCIADACMAWHWFSVNNPSDGGFCGLAGQPARR